MTNTKQIRKPSVFRPIRRRQFNRAMQQVASAQEFYRSTPIAPLLDRPLPIPMRPDMSDAQ